MTATQTPTSGVQTYVNYGYETTYGTVAATFPRTFGHGIKLTTWDMKNNMEKVFPLGQRNAATAVAKQFEGGATVEFVLSDGGFWRGVLGCVADAGSGPYCHTYTEQTTLPSLSIATGSCLGTCEEVTAVTGFKITQATLTAAVNELVKVKLDGVFQNFSTVQTGLGSQVAETYIPYTFAMGCLAFAGSTIANVQNFELTVKNNTDSLYSLGQRTLTNIIEKTREYDFNLTIAQYCVTTLLSLFSGTTSPYTASANNTPASTSCLVLTFTNGLASTSLQSMVVTIDNIYIDTYSLPKTVDEIVKENVTGMALGTTANSAITVWYNNTASDSSTP